MSEITELHMKLVDIQQRLEVPKLRQNDFGGFVYRNVEDIEKAVKPLLKEHGLTLIFSDEMVAVGDRVYVKATASLHDGSENKIAATAYAREATDPKKKTDDAQLTGGCSSYARKYAAQGLFLIDDGKGDPDNPKTEDATASGLAALSQAKTKLFKAFKAAGIDDSQDMMANIQQATGKDVVETIDDVEKVIKHLEAENERN